MGGRARNYKEINNRSYAKNKERYREEDRKKGVRTKRAAFELLGGVCVVCGFSDFRALQVDHVNGGGVKELRELSHGTVERYQRVLDNPEKYQLLCANHNAIKRWEKKEGPLQVNPYEGEKLLN